MGILIFMGIFAVLAGLPFAMCFGVKKLGRIFLPEDEKMDAGLYGVVAGALTVVVYVFPGLPLLLALKPEWA